jgi:hypothetical protein
MLKTNTSDELSRYRLVAQGMAQSGLYSPLIEAVMDCKNTRGTFIVIDSPSGTGKSLAGIALQEIGRSSGDFELIHIVWGEAVSSQKIYSQIVESQKHRNILSQNFYSRASKMLPSQIPPKDPVVYDAHVWEHLLQYLFAMKDHTQGQKFDMELARNKLNFLFCSWTRCQLIQSMLLLWAV